MNKRDTLNLLNEVMGLGEALTMGEVLRRIKASGLELARTAIICDVHKALDFARDELGSVSFLNRVEAKGPVAVWTRNCEIIEAPEKQQRSDRMTIITYDFPTQSATAPRANPITVPAYPWEAAT